MSTLPHRGVVVSFDADRGFGFIRSPAFAEDVFVHASAPGASALGPGRRVSFEAEPSDRGPRAVRVVAGRRGLTPAGAGWLALGLGLAIVSGALVYLGWSWVWAWLAAINLATPLAYAIDKRRARSARRRIPEAVLLGLALVGGSPSAALAMGWLRHKTRKMAFLAPFVVIVALQVAALIYGLLRRPS